MHAQNEGKTKFNKPSSYHELCYLENPENFDTIYDKVCYSNGTMLYGTDFMSKIYMFLFTQVVN